MNSDGVNSQPDACNRAKGGRMVVQTDLGRMLRELRERMGLTQEKLAPRLGVTLATINRWENGHTRPSPLALRQESR